MTIIRHSLNKQTITIFFVPQKIIKYREFFRFLVFSHIILSHYWSFLKFKESCFLTGGFVCLILTNGFLSLIDFRDNVGNFDKWLGFYFVFGGNLHFLQCTIFFSGTGEPQGVQIGSPTINHFIIIIIHHHYYYLESKSITYRSNAKKQ
jgi:hypothetical protein